MKITLYGIYHYDRSAKARWLLTELGVPHENIWLDREKKEHEGEAYHRINPMGRVPALVVDGKAMFESGALCAYLADLFLEGKMAPALSAPERAEYQQWMYFAATTVDPFATRIMIIEDIPPGEVFKNKEADFLAEVRQAIQVLDSALSNKDYLVGNKFSAADICVSYHLYFCMLWPEMKVIFDDYLNVLHYLERLQKRASAIEAKVFKFA